MADNQYENNNVEFSGEHNVLYSRFEPSNKVPSLIKLVMKLGCTQEQANYVLIGFALIAIVISTLLFFSIGSGSHPSEEEMRKIPLPGSEAPSR